MTSKTKPDVASKPQKPDEKPPEEVNVVVTGFSPWGTGTPWPPMPINTSWLIVDALPPVTVRDKKPNIRIITYPRPVHGAWTSVRKLVPKIWDGDKDLFGLHKHPDSPHDTTFKVHAILHMGMLDEPDSPYRLERNGFKTGYLLPDQDGKEPTKDDLTGDGMWDGLPDLLSTDIDIDGVFAKIKAKLDDPKIAIFNGIYPFMCCYLYWASLAEGYKRNEQRRVLFLHTPIEHESEDIERGVKLATAIIEAMIEDVENRA